MITTTSRMMISVSIVRPASIGAGVGVAPTGVGSVTPVGVKTAW